MFGDYTVLSGLMIVPLMTPAAKSTVSNLASPPTGCAPQGQKPWRRAGFTAQIVAPLAEGASTAGRPGPRRPMPRSCSSRNGFMGASMVDDHATAQPPGLTLELYAAAKALPVSFLRECGLSDIVLADRPVVRIPYLGAGGVTTFRWFGRRPSCGLTSCDALAG
jgi:hypothetical protein